MQGHEHPPLARETMIDRYARQPAVLSDLAERLGPAELQRPARPAGWSAHQVLVHVRDVEIQAYLPRLERILDEADPLFADFDAERWMSTHYLPAEPVNTVLADFAAARVGGLALIRGLAAADWQRPGRHPDIGSRPFEWWITRAVEHAEEHLVELAGRLASLGVGGLNG
ncbi:MAG: DinB family protein [Anaerolineales bacterium]|nr:DinB family protein [Anaerolineales bacterium]